jgi:murein L,D-transpeptidase YcbB/YkuD
MHDQRIPAIRKRLSITGDLRSKDLYSEIYDAALREAVVSFQMRHGLEVDGVLGKATRKAMNIPVEVLIRRIVINMERWRWLSHDLGETRVEVNIAGFVLESFKSNKREFSMPVIVGKLQHETPVFSDMITYLDFNPYWNIPPSIAEHEMLPELEKDPHYLAERTIRVFSSWEADAIELDSTRIDWHAVGDDIVRYKLRQDPGPNNALGTVKFVFPNEYDVYLHDTPTRNLFGRSQRAFSHGCIRVSRPYKLASYLLGGGENGWGIDRIREIIASGERTVVRLEEPVPVHIAYRTVWLDDDGSVHFREDVYGRDTLLEDALF